MSRPQFGRAFEVIDGALVDVAQLAPVRQLHPTEPACWGCGVRVPADQRCPTCRWHGPELPRGAELIGYRVGWDRSDARGLTEAGRVTAYKPNLEAWVVEDCTDGLWRVLPAEDWLRSGRLLPPLASPLAR